MLCLVTQSCLTFYNPMDCSPPGSSFHEDSPGKNTTVGCHALLQGIFPTQGWNPGLQHCTRILYQLSHQASLYGRLGFLKCLPTESNYILKKSLSRVRLFATPWTIVRGLLQARIVGWVAFPFSRGSSQPRDGTQVSRIAGGFFTS